MIDLRSDTVTRPTPAMRRAMFEAEVGDDVYREDPTVNRLEERAAATLGIPVQEIAASADTVMFCLSKGLGAPVGSILAGPAELMETARLYRKRLGGGMRQAGVLAAAALVALEESPPKLAIDHANARFLAEGIARIPGMVVDPAKVATNVVVFDVSGTGVTPA